MTSVSLLGLEKYLDASNLSPLSTAIKCAWAVFNQTVLMYNLNEICLGFNGGKDCTLVLHLYIAYLKKMFPEHSRQILSLYIQNVTHFKEADQFMEECRANYNLNMIIIPGDIKTGLEKLKKSHPNIKAVIMGTRRHDPYSSTLRSFAPTDDDWPDYMRILPILDWSYSEVWRFLREFDLPYCKLYDEGYTSIGSEKNTKKNPALLLDDGRYSPAYLLDDEEKERCGRESK